MTDALSIKTHITLIHIDYESKGWFNRCSCFTDLYMINESKALQGSEKHRIASLFHLQYINSAGVLLIFREAYACFNHALLWRAASLKSIKLSSPNRTNHGNSLPEEHNSSCSRQDVTSSPRTDTGKSSSRWSSKSPPVKRPKSIVHMRMETDLCGSILHERGMFGCIQMFCKPVYVHRVNWRNWHNEQNVCLNKFVTKTKILHVVLCPDKTKFNHGMICGSKFYFWRRRGQTRSFRPSGGSTMVWDPIAENTGEIYNRSLKTLIT